MYRFDKSVLLRIFDATKVKLLKIRKRMRKTKVTFNHERLQYSAELLRALAHPLRLRILEFIDRNDSINVNKIYNTLNLEQSITSQHLRILRKAGVVHAERDGKFILYSIDYPTLVRAEKAVQNFLQQDRVRALGKQ